MVLMDTDTDENQQPQIPPPRPQPTGAVAGTGIQLKPIIVWSILVLFLALSFTLYNLFLKTAVIASPSTVSDSVCILWMAPFLSGGGYSSEAWSYILALNAYIQNQKNPLFKLGIEHHGDLENVNFWEGLPSEMRNLAIKLHETHCGFDNRTIVVCHSEPGAWRPPLFQTFPCPPAAYRRFKFVIGRTMFETDRVNADHVERCNRMDHVWVPTDFHVNTFRQSGVDSNKVRKIVQPVDLEFFDPLKVKQLDLAVIATTVLGFDLDGLNLKDRFNFLSIFKWEYRKGWDVLLRGYLKEFSAVDKVALFLLTNAYHSDSDFANKIIEFVNNSELERPPHGWAPIYVIDGHIPQAELPSLYKAVDAFVLPSRGEGWGRPIVEAMAMMLPVITTNWSGQTEYLTSGNSYPLIIKDMNEVKEGPFKGHMWAEPSVDMLQLLMRHVVKNPNEAKTKGIEGRRDMMRRFSPEIVAGDIINHLQRIVAN